MYRCQHAGSEIQISLSLTFVFLYYEMLLMLFRLKSTQAQTRPSETRVTEPRPSSIWTGGQTAAKSLRDIQAEEQAAKQHQPAAQQQSQTKRGAQQQRVSLEATQPPSVWAAGAGKAAVPPAKSLRDIQEEEMRQRQAAVHQQQASTASTAPKSAVC